MNDRRCPCGLRPAPCPDGYELGDGPIDCPVWEAYVRPHWWERVTGAVIAFLMGRW